MPLLSLQSRLKVHEMWKARRPVIEVFSQPFRKREQTEPGLKLARSCHPVEHPLQPVNDHKRRPFAPNEQAAFFSNLLFGSLLACRSAKITHRTMPKAGKCAFLLAALGQRLNPLTQLSGYDPISHGRKCPVNEWLGTESADSLVTFQGNTATPAKPKLLSKHQRGQLRMTTNQRRHSEAFPLCQGSVSPNLRTICKATFPTDSISPRAVPAQPWQA